MTQNLREAVVDLDAVRYNVAVLRGHSGSAGVMAVVKADAYGHGLVPCARAALDGGATWLGVALLDEALALRAAGVTAPVLSWLLGPGERWVEAIAADVDLSVAAVWALDEVVAAATARRAGAPGSTSRSTPGSAAAAPPRPVARAGRGGRGGRRATAWCASSGSGRTSPTRTRRAIRRSTASSRLFEDALELAEAAGLRPGGPAPGQLGCGAHPLGHPVRPDPARAGRLRAVADPRDRDLRPAGAATGHDPACQVRRW